MSTPAPFRFVTQNVRAKPRMAQPLVVADVKLTASQADVVAWQEIGPDRYKAALRDLDGWAHAHLDTTDPVSWRTEKFTRRSTGSVPLHRGTAAWDARAIGWVELEDNATGARFVVFSVHFVAGAWNDKELANKELRQAIWLEGQQALARQLAAWAAAGVPVVGGGDFNRRNPYRGELLAGPSAGGRRIRYPLAGKAPMAIDHVLVLDGDHAGFDIGEYRYLEGRNSDHEGRGVTLTLAPAVTAPVTPPAPPVPTPDPTPEEPTMPTLEKGLCPFADHKIIPAGANDPAITPRVAILHVDAGNAESLYDYFAHRSGGIESHFHVRRDGSIEQYRNIFRQADANNLANDFAVSIETQGYGAGEWTPEQLAAIKRLLTWLHAEAGIPLRKVEKWDGAGVGFHTQFGAPGPWTPVSKSCPGPDRKVQYWEELVPWLAAQQGGPAGPDKPVDKRPAVDLSNVAEQASVVLKLKGVRRIQAALNKELGAKLARDGVFGPETRAAYKAWQIKLGYDGKDADGIPGQESLAKLGDRHGFKVRA